MKRYVRYLLSGLPILQTLKNWLVGLSFVPYEHEFRLLKDLHLGDTDVVVDVGANRGFAIKEMRRFCPKSAVVAFEPNPLLAAELTRRFGHDPRVKIHALACGA